MARYQLRRPAPVTIFPRHFRRQGLVDPAAPAAGKEEDDGPESPDSPASSGSESGDEDEDEDVASSAPGQDYNGTDLSSLSLFNPSATAAPQVTGTAASAEITGPAVTDSSIIVRPANPDPTSRATSSPQLSGERTMITKEGVIAAAILSVLGALALIVAGVILYKRRKRRQLNRPSLPDDTFDPNNTNPLHAPETAHMATKSMFGGIGSHLTRSTDRSNTLFGPGPYERPETVSTERDRLTRPASIVPPQPTPNPFADPPLNKAYDVLAGRPRSTTLTDRGSWVKNPFRNPDSERFDPFGELQQKARDERVRYIEELRREAEIARQAEGTGKIQPGALNTRKESGVTVEGLGVLDRFGGSGAYR